MKKVKLNTKLSLNKEVVTKLNTKQMVQLNGGREPSTYAEQVCLETGTCASCYCSGQASCYCSGKNCA